MKKIIIATHHKLAEGFKSTLNYIAPDVVDIIAINAYVGDEELPSQIEEALSQFEKDEQIFVFTDLLGGSVNQEFAKMISSYNLKLVTGINLPVVLSIALAASAGELRDEEINRAIVESQQQLVNVNEYLMNQVYDDDDE